MECSWYDRLMRLQLIKSSSSDFVLERVIVCGPHFVGKTRILQKLINSDHESNVSTINYKSLLHSHDKEYILQYLERRRDNKIYEHSSLQIILNGIISDILPKYNAASLESNQKLINQLIARCKKLMPQTVNLDKRVIILIDATSSFFLNHMEYLPFLHLQVIAYLSIITNFQHFVKFIIVYREDLHDSILDYYKIYDLIYDCFTPSITNRNIRIVPPEQFVEVAQLTIVDSHKQEILDLDHMM